MNAHAQAKGGGERENMKYNLVHETSKLLACSPRTHVIIDDLCTRKMTGTKVINYYALAGESLGTRQIQWPCQCANFQNSSYKHVIAEAAMSDFGEDGYSCLFSISD